MIFFVFSKDRPMQLDAALRSLRNQCEDLAAIRVTVLWRASTSRLISAYRRLARDYPEIDFVREYDFRRDLLALLPAAGKIGFIVDDTIFVRPFSALAMGELLDRQPDALGVSLRLGKNTTYCYSLNRPQALPDFVPLAQGALKFQWTAAEHDFAYPLEVSSSIFRAAEIAPLLRRLPFKNPNLLEAAMAEEAKSFQATHPVLLTAETSLAFSAPANKVQEVCANRAGENPAYTPEALASAFLKGERIRLAPLENFTPNACHQEVQFEISAEAEPVPLASVIIPCFKQAAYLPEAVASVIAQTMADWEIIIVNDGSPDDTSAVAQDLMKKYSGRRIRLLEKTNGGLAHARNAGIRVAAGAYILPLDADDLLDPAMLEKTVALLEQSPGLAIAYSDVAHFGAVEKTVRAAEFDLGKLRDNNQLNYCSLFRREAWEAAGGYNPNMIWGYEDWDFWLSCGALGMVAQRIPGALLRYRVKESSMYTAAVAHDAQLRARLILNHPALYSENQQAEARKIWSDPALPLAPGSPKVSVIVPTFNRPGRLEEALRSVGAQTLRDFEIIVVNDNGVEVEPAIARCKTAGEIISLRHSANRGLAAARNTGLRHARGRYIAYLDDDDIFLPDHLQTLADFLERTGNKAAYTDAWCAHEEWAGGQYKVTKREALYSADWDNDRILSQNFVPVLCFMHDRSAGIAAGEFDEQMTTHEDWDFWIRLSRVCAPVHVKQITCEFRQRQDGSSMTSARRADFLRTAKIIFKKYKSYSAGKPEVRKQQRRALRHLKREVGGNWFDSLFGRFFQPGSKP